MITTSTLEILSNLGETIAWENTGTLGTIINGEVSTFNVKANLSNSSFKLNYYVHSGLLPNGLTLISDGTITGTANFLPIGTTFYDFEVSAIDSTGYKFLEPTPFRIIAENNTSTNYTSSYFKINLDLQDRKKFKDFSTNNKIFIPEFIYRPNDKNFGIQTDLKMILNFGITDTSFSIYTQQIKDKNFQRRKLKIGELKTAVAIENNKKIYEIIYVDVIDDILFDTTTTSFTFNNETYYPPSIGNMRSIFKNSSYNIETTESLNPKFTKNTQPTNSKILNYIPFIPICYCIPEKSAFVLKNIKNSNFKFNLLNFEIDRLYIQNTYLSKLNYYIFE